MREIIKSVYVALWQRNRALPRQPRDEVVFLFSVHVPLGEAKLEDETEIGAKICAEEATVHTRARYMLKPSSGTLYSLKSAWQRGRAAGYEYVAAHYLSGLGRRPELAHIERFWTSRA